MHSGGSLNKWVVFLALSVLLPALPIAGAGSETNENPVQGLKPASLRKPTLWQIVSKYPHQVVAYPYGFLTGSFERLAALSGDFAWVPKMRDKLIWRDGALGVRPSVAINGTLGLQLTRSGFLMPGSQLQLSLESGDRFDTGDWRWQARYSMKVDRLTGWLFSLPFRP